MKESLSNEMAIQSGDRLANECERYGMTWGCDEECPVLNKGNCELYSSVEEYLKGCK